MLVQALSFMHRRGGFALCAQARGFCKTVQNHRACQRKSRVCKIVKKNNVNLTVLTEKVRQPRAELPLFLRCPRRRPPKANNVNSSPSAALLRHSLRAPPGPLPDGSRPPPGQLPGTSRAPPGHRLRAQTPAICPNSSS